MRFDPPLRPIFSTVRTDRDTVREACPKGTPTRVQQGYYEDEPVNKITGITTTIRHQVNTITINLIVLRCVDSLLIAC